MSDKKNIYAMYDSNNTMSLEEVCKLKGIKYITKDARNYAINLRAQNSWEYKLGQRLYNPVAEESEHDQRNTLFNKNAKGNILEKTAGTIGDIGLNLLKGVVSAGEKLGDLASYGVAGAADLLGFDDYADSVREGAQFNLTGSLFKDVQTQVNQYSVFGDTLDSVLQSVGESFSSAKVSGRFLKSPNIDVKLGKFNIGIPKMSVLTGMSSGMTEAYQNGANDNQALIKGITSGLAEGISEGFFGVFGQGGSSIEKSVMDRINSNVSSNILRRLTKTGVQSIGEGLEEGISYTLNFIADNLQDAINDVLGNEVKKMGKEWSWEELAQNIGTGALAGFISSGGTQISNDIRESTYNKTGKQVKGYQNNVIESTIANVQQELNRPLTEIEQESIARQVQELYKDNNVNTQQIVNNIKSEEIVLNTLVNEEIKKLQEDGKEVSNKEKNKIEENIRKELENGSIDLDKLTKILGGEDLEKYNEIQKKQKRIDKLNKIIEENEKAPTKGVTNAIKERENLQKEVSNSREVFDRLKSNISSIYDRGSLLNKSYQEAYNKTQKYQEDVSKYSEKEQKIVQKAIDSGIINNSRKSHQLVDLIAKISADKNIDFNFTNNENLKNSGFSVNTNGFINSDGITINIESNTALESVIGHEITHVLEGTDLYNELQNSFKELLGEEQYQQRLEKIKDIYKNVKDANYENELTSDLVGEYLFTDKDFVNNLSIQKPNLFKKIYNEIKYLYKQVTGTQQEKTIAKIKKIFDEAYRNTNNEVKEFKYALKQYGAEDFTKETNNNLKMKGITVIESKSELINKIERALSNEDIQTNFTIGAINDEVKNKIENDLNLKLFKDTQYSLLLNDDDIKHIKKHFNSNEEIADEILRLFDIVSNYDNVSYTKHNTENRLIFEKNYSNADVRTIEIISNKNNALDLVSIYYTKKRSQLDHSATSKSSFERESTSYVDNISQNDIKVNDNTLSTNNDMQNDVKNTSFSLKDNSSSNKNDIAPVKGDLTYGRDIKIQEAIAPINNKIEELTQKIDKLIPTSENIKKVTDLPKDPTKESSYDNELTDKQKRRKVIDEYRQLAKDQLQDITKIKDKKRGIQYQVNTMKRNLRDIMSPEQAQAMYNTYFKPITENNAKIEQEINSYNERIDQFELTDEESVYTQMLGELKYNPETTLTEQYVEDYYQKHKKDIDKNIVNDAIEEFRSVYDELIDKMNNVLEANGLKQVDYRKGYFPHFFEEKPTSILGKLSQALGWKVNKGTLPTEIAGRTEEFKPNKRWTPFSQQRTGDTTDYNALKGYDNYIRGAMDVIYHTEDIQRLRALENEIRYQYSTKGIQEKIDQIYNDNSLDTEQKNDMIAQFTLDMKNNELGNFATELRNYTDNLANKKSFGDRDMERLFGRETYSIMQNINNRVSANMVGANISSAMTNFIPITQAWSQTSTKNMMRAMYDTIKASIKDDGFSSKSTYLVNRTQQAERLYKSNLDKINAKLGIPFEAIDSFTSNTIVRAKYYDNIEKGMTESQAIDNANEFAKDVMAGRSKGDMPTYFNQKNPITKLFTAFQLEVNNQFGYMFKDIPVDLADEAKEQIVLAFVKMFLGAYLYNMLSQKITGRKAAFSPIDMAIDDISTINNEELNLGEKISNIATDTLKEAPFIGGIMGGGRLPIQGAIPYNNPLEMVTSTLSDASAVFDSDPEKKQKAINTLLKEWEKPLFYIAMPFAGGQLKKTKDGLSMYDEKLPVAGSYTNGEDLRFTADKSTMGKIKSALFGQYSSKEAQDYIDSGFKSISKKNLDELQELDMTSSEYRKFKKEFTEASKTTDNNKYILYKDKNNNYYWYDKDDKVVYDDKYNTTNKSITNLSKVSKKERQLNYLNTTDLSDSQKNYLMNKSDEDEVRDQYGFIKYKKDVQYLKNKKVATKTVNYYYDDQNKKLYDSDYNEVNDTDLSELTKVTNNKDYSGYKNYNSFEEFELYQKNPKKYSLFKSTGIDYQSYSTYEKDLSNIKSDVDKNGVTISNSRKKKVINYINNLNVDYSTKLILLKKEYNSDKRYDKSIVNYIYSTNLTDKEKLEALESLGFTIKNGKIYS